MIASNNKVSEQLHIKNYNNIPKKKIDRGGNKEIKKERNTPNIDDDDVALTRRD